MKKTVVILFCLALAFSYGCQTNPVVNNMPAAPNECSFPDDGKTAAPLWICDAPVEGVEVSAVGSHEPTQAGIDFQKTMAAAAARESLARSMKSKITNMIKRYAQTTGAGSSETVDKVNTSVSKLLTSETLENTRIYRSLKNPNTGVLYVLVGLSAAPMRENVQKAVKTSMNNERALWQEFKATKAQDELAADISKMMTD
jgi:hypothetical protein